MPDRSNVQRALVRGACGVALVAIAGAGIVAARVVPEPSQTSLEPVAVTANDGQAVLACTGGLLRPAAQGLILGEEEPEIRGWAGVRSFSQDQGEGQWGESTSELGTPQLAGALVLPRGEEPPWAAGATQHSANGGDLRGLATNTCLWPSSSAWLVGSSVGIGRSNIVMLTNPSPRPIQVQIDAFTSTGAAALSGNSAVALAAGETSAISLDGLLGDDDRIALHLSTDAGVFAATMQHTELAGTAARGIGFVSPAALGKRVVVPGVSLTPGQVNLGGAAGAEQTGASTIVDQNLSAAVRIVNPNETEQSVTVTLIDSEGRAAPLPGGKAQVPAQSVLDLSLDGVAAGDYAVAVAADAPITAGVKMTRASDSGRTDVAWIGASDALEQGAGALGEASGRLVVTTTASLDTEDADPATLEWKAYDENGDETGSGSFEWRGTAGIDLPQGSAYVTLSADQSVYAAIALTSSEDQGAGIDSVPIAPRGGQLSATRVVVAD